MRPLFALALGSAVAACHSSQARIDIVVGGDGGSCARAQAGADSRAADAGILDAGILDSGPADSEPSDAGPSDAGAAADDLHCVNFLEFGVHEGSNFSTQCIKLDRKLATLCDIADLADGRELFKLDPNSSVTLTVKGLRVFPATSCEVNSFCQAREIFRGDVGPVRVGDLAGAAIALPVVLEESCGPPETFFFKPSGGTCASVCLDSSRVVCEFGEGCLCK